MNSSILRAIDFQSWFIPCDIITGVCLLTAIILGSLFLLIIIFDRTCHTIPMMLVANSCLAQVLFSSNTLVMIAFSLANDLQQIYFQHSFCVFQGYFSFVGCTAMNHSFLLQAIYRYIIVVYPTRMFWQSMRMQLFLICITWIFALLYPLAFLYTGDITYNGDNQLCQIPFRLSFALLFMISNAYLLPVSVIQVIYLRLVRYVKDMSKRVDMGNSLSRMQRELKMVRRIVLIVTILVMLGLPYTTFLFMSFFTDPPKYHFRISSIFINSSLMFVTIALFMFTDPLKSSVKRRLQLRQETVVPTVWHR